ncbi:MAG: helix-turn-helix domain-containing protein [Candidatus Woesearchaeota archaeon]|jgi:sugar-specific transcriptional regulator TrmB|nr:helix-turn-helix domain-containing protein [Candidatus Woesearchaeota archaeon]MDP7199079.1 helix-turn-helix domain-containing protein [Candidatus Woesearchaeota archaeon]MDP7467789.1 helix-turn-helix domain-containing protein [Candidatus Woesearchaeota archaeon]MDP7646492.1 helix-turn-helix domain-containing protein [Candidatus Woesearchaeota archaeon]
MDTSTLEQLGLSKREAKAYLALLELGTSTIGSIVKKTDIPSSKIYEVLDRLIEKSLVSYVTIKHTKHFQAAEPEKIVHYYDERKAQFMEILPLLQEKRKQAEDKQNVELYEGKQAVFNSIYNLVRQAKKGEEYLSFSFGKEHEDPDIHRFYANLTWRRVEKGLKIRVLCHESARHIMFRYGTDIAKRIKLRFTNFTFPQGIVLVGNKLVIVNWEDKPTTIVITSHTITEQFRQFFYELYKQAKL